MKWLLTAGDDSGAFRLPNHFLDLANSGLSDGWAELEGLRPFIHGGVLSLDIAMLQSQQSGTSSTSCLALFSSSPSMLEIWVTVLGRLREASNE
jgi:hypothetical protein